MLPTDHDRGSCEDDEDPDNGQADDSEAVCPGTFSATAFRFGVDILVQKGRWLVAPEADLVRWYPDDMTMRFGNGYSPWGGITVSRAFE